MLVELYERVVVPLVVYDEIVVAGAGLPGSTEVAGARWLEVEDSPPDPALVGTLDRGEAAAIPLAERLGAMLLCDDARGRSEARRRGLPVIGTLVVLVLAKDRRLLDSIGPVIDAMRAVGMYVSDVLVREALAAAGEVDASQG